VEEKAQKRIVKTKGVGGQDWLYQGGVGGGGGVVGGVGGGGVCGGGGGVGGGGFHDGRSGSSIWQSIPSRVGAE